MLTSTKGPLSEGVAMLTERERSPQSVLCSCLYSCSLSLSLSAFFIYFSFLLPTVITPALSSVAQGVAGQHQLLVENLQRMSGGVLLTGSLRGNIRL